MPVKAAGWRIEPPVSVPVAPRQRSAATAAAEPPDEPPGVSAAGVARPPPGADRRAVDRGLVRAPHGELVHVELADADRARLPELARHRALVGRAEALEDARRRLRRRALDAEEILDPERDAAEVGRVARLQPRRRRGSPGAARSSGVGAEKALSAPGASAAARQASVSSTAPIAPARSRVARLGDGQARRARSFDHLRHGEEAGARVRRVREHLVADRRRR